MMDAQNFGGQQKGNVKPGTVKKALVFVCGLPDETVADDEAHLYEFGSAAPPTVQQMVDAIIQRLGLLQLLKDHAEEQQKQNQPPALYVVMKLDKEFGKFVKINPNDCRVEHQAEYKIKFREAVGSQKMEQFDSSSNLSSAMENLNLNKEEREKLKEYERKMNTCMVCIADKSQMRKHDRQAETNLPCPLARSDGSSEGIQSETLSSRKTSFCPSNDSFWECDDCGRILFLVMPKDNSPITHFYCDCGTGPIAALAFRCKNSHLHENSNFTKFNPNQLVGLLKRFEQFKEKNILILGETGVGKSTFINAFGNVLSHNTLEEALQAEKPICLIPAQFTLPNEKWEPCVVGICQHGVGLECEECKKDGKSNENFVGADSRTQFPMAHVITGVKGGRVRIIDTPGIGDTRNKDTDQDKKNIRNILSYIATIDHIHCICILLKPNISRLTVQFSYCLKELLSNLHKNAAKNIVFCFTNARATLYKPGDTLIPLNVVLEELARKTGIQITVNSANSFCVDNEAFRFLCAAKAGIKFTDEDYKNFSESWQRSQQEFNRLLNYMTDHLEPHKTRETTSLNEARYIITTLSKPLAIITRNIQSNITKMHDETQRLAGLNTEAADFRSKLKIQNFYTAKKPLDFPRTVCVAKEHTKVKKDANGNTQTVYTTHCHDHCYLNIPEETYPSIALMQCAAIDGLVCKHCGCKWDMHMHIRYEQEEKLEWIDNVNVKRMLDDNEDRKKIQQKAIEDAKKRMNDLEEEQKTITQVAAKAGRFLKNNSLMAINDAVEEYLKLLIKESKREAEDTDKDYRRADGLEQTLNAYLEQKKCMEYLMADQSGVQNAETLKPEHIKLFRDQLFSLKLKGKEIEELFKAEEDGRHANRLYQENTFNRRVPNQASNNGLSNYQYQHYQRHHSSMHSSGFGSTTRGAANSSHGNNARQSGNYDYVNPSRAGTSASTRRA